MLNSINHHFPSVQPIMKQLNTVYNEGGRVSWGGICCDNHSFPKIAGNYVSGLTTRKSLRPKAWDKGLFLPHSLVPQSTFSVSLSQWQKVALSAKTR